ncbi:MAG TPA: hypothetical protein VHZ54_18670 [Solirubrobacterales bacterium]|nr:hypothetical protein [Solirubrobacterales bacterium]
MDERDQKRQLIDAQTEGTGRLRSGVGRARAGLDRARGRAEQVRLSIARKRSGAADGDERERIGTGGRIDADGAREAVEDAGWFLRRHVAWPAEDRIERLGRRGAIGVFGGGGIAVAGVVAALVIAGSGGSGQSAGTTEAFVTPQRSPAPAPAAAVPAPKPKAKKATEPTGPTLHGAPPDFAPAQHFRSGVADGTAVGGNRSGSTGGVPASRGAASGSDATGGSAADSGAVTSANDTPASTAKIGATPGATASAQARASKAATASNADVAETGGESGGGANEGELSGPPAPKAAKRVARRFAEAFVVYEIGGTDTKVRKAFGQTSTKQLSRSLLHRPPRQPASVKVPRAKVVNVVAGPSKGSVYTVSVSLLRVGVTSELRLEMEQGVGKKWQVTNVLG